MVRLEDLPQGLVPPPEQKKKQKEQQQQVPPPPEEDGPAYPTVVLQARRNMQKFDNCVLLTRVGGFYELYFEQADEYGPLLNIKVAQKKTAAGPVPMVLCPVPDPEPAAVARVPPRPAPLTALTAHVLMPLSRVPRPASPSSSWTATSRCSSKTSPAM